MILTGRARTVTLVGEATWAPAKNGGRLLRDLERTVAESGLPLADKLVYALCAREEVTHLPADRDAVLVVTAADIFA